MKVFFKWSLATAATFFLLAPVFFGLRSSSVAWLSAVAVVFTISSIAQKRANIRSYDALNLLKITSVTFVIQSLVVGVLYLIGHGIGRVLSYNLEGAATSSIFEGLMLGLLILSSLFVELTKSLAAKTAPQIMARSMREQNENLIGLHSQGDLTESLSRVGGDLPAGEKLRFEELLLNGPDHFQLGDLNSGFSNKTSVSFANGKLALEIYNDEGKGFRFTDFVFPGTEPRLKATHPGGQSYIWETGFSFGARFFGEIRIQPGTFAMKGEVRPDYEAPGSGIPVSLKMTLPEGVVDPKHFKFSSLEEAESAGSDCVYSLNVSLSRPSEFARVLKFKKLNELILRAEFEGGNISDRGSALPSIVDTSTLLDGISQLQNLNRLWFTSDVPVEIPLELFNLVSLKDVSFSAKANVLPVEVMKLVNLESLRISRNRFTTLPTELGDHPRLRYLNIEDCCFESLPKSISKIETIKIEHARRALYMDLSYPHGKDVPLNHEIFLVRSHKTLKEELDRKIDAIGLSEFRELLHKLARRAIDLRTPRDIPSEKLSDLQSKFIVGASRLGGFPDLPSLEDWPLAKDHANVEHKMRFLAQLNCAELAKLQDYLPRNGLISFFIDQWNDHPSFVRAVYFPSLIGMAPMRLPADEILSDGERADAFSGVQLEPRVLISIPDLSVDEGLWGPGPPEDLKRIWENNQGEAYEKLKADLDNEQLSGSGRFGPHTINAYVFTQGDSPEMQASEEKLGTADDWVNLISIGFDRNVGFQFDDCGTLTICIHKSDLATQNFSRVFPSIYSS